MSNTLQPAKHLLLEPMFLSPFEFYSAWGKLIFETFCPTQFLPQLEVFTGFLNYYCDGEKVYPKSVVIELIQNRKSASVYRASTHFIWKNKQGEMKEKYDYEITVYEKQEGSKITTSYFHVNDFNNHIFSDDLLEEFSFLEIEKVYAPTMISSCDCS